MYLYIYTPGYIFRKSKVKPSKSMEVSVLSCIEGYAAILDKPAGVTTEELLRQFEPIGQIWFRFLGGRCGVWVMYSGSVFLTLLYI